MDRPFDLPARATPATYINGRLAEEDEVNLGRFQLADGARGSWFTAYPYPTSHVWGLESRAIKK